MAKGRVAKSITTAYILSTLSLLTFGCRNSPKNGSPSLDETVTWMAQALHERNGLKWRDNERPLAKLTRQGCNLKYETWSGETISVDLSDIDPKTIKIQTIGPNPWVVFDTRDFHQSVRYHSSDPNAGSLADYGAPDGGYELNSADVATSFEAAIQRAVALCGGKPSTF